MPFTSLSVVKGPGQIPQGGEAVVGCGGGKRAQALGEEKGKRSGGTVQVGAGLS